MDEERDAGAVRTPADPRRVRAAYRRMLSALEDKRRRLRMLKACAGLSAPWVEGVLWDALCDPCEENRDFLVRALAARPEIDRETGAARLVTGAPWIVRSAAARIFALRKDAAAIPHLQKLLKDPNIDVRRTAAEAVGAIGGPKALAILVKFRKDACLPVRAAAERGIERLSEIRFC